MSALKLSVYNLHLKGGVLWNDVVSAMIEANSDVSHCIINEQSDIYIGGYYIFETLQNHTQYNVDRNCFETVQIKCQNLIKFDLYIEKCVMFLWGSKRVASVFITLLEQSAQANIIIDLKQIVNAKTRDGTNISGDILDFFADGFNRIRSSAFKEYYVDQPTKSDGVLAVRMTYKRKLPGKNKLIQEETRHVNIRIQKKNETEVSVDIRQTASIDAQRALEILEKVVGNSDETGVYLSHINLETLTDRNKVAFFDQLTTYSFNDYRLKTITGITVKKSTLSDEDDIDAEVIEDDEASGALEGISQAVLNGNGLRSNAFVQDSLEQGYYITTMRYRYICMQEAGEFIVSISSKGKDLRVDIDKSYADDDGKLYIQPFSKALQDEIIQKFQQAANHIYADLQQRQKQCTLSAPQK